jgi:hypothetical protein
MRAGSAHRTQEDRPLIVRFLRATIPFAPAFTGAGHFRWWLFRPPKIPDTSGFIKIVY